MGLEKGIGLYKVLIGPFENPERESSWVSFSPLNTGCEEGAFLFKSNVHISFSGTSVFMFCFACKLHVLVLLGFFLTSHPLPPSLMF